MTGSRSNNRMPTRRVFGLSITEEVEWGFADAVGGTIVGRVEHGVFPDIPAGNLPHKPDELIDIEQKIRSRLFELKRSNPSAFENVLGIGISTIGVVDRVNLRLDNITRKNWAKKNSLHLIDFPALLLTPGSNGQILFPRISSNDQIVLQNDASARCITEHLYGVDNPGSIPSLLYLMVGEGVNGAIIYNGDLPLMARHPEMGHILPQLDRYDMAFDVTFSGCPSHGTCFEGLASLARFRQQWGTNLSQLPKNHPAWAIAVSYLTQMAIIGVQMLNPAQIRFGGAVFTGARGLELIDEVCERFWRFNNNYLPDYNTRDAVDKLIGRARLGNGVKVLSAITMGCFAAFPRAKYYTIEKAGGKVSELRHYMNSSRSGL